MLESFIASSISAFGKVGGLSRVVRVRRSMKQNLSLYEAVTGMKSKMDSRVAKHLGMAMIYQAVMLMDIEEKNYEKSKSDLKNILFGCVVASVCIGLVSIPIVILGLSNPWVWWLLFLPGLAEVLVILVFSYARFFAPSDPDPATVDVSDVPDDEGPGN